jgi:hypothetical protein
VNARRASSRLAGLAPVALAAALAACGTIPLSTATRFSAFDEKDFAALDPGELRVRLSVPRGYSWDAAGIRLGVQVGAGRRERSEDFRLEEVASQAGKRGSGWLSAGTAVSVTTLRLARESTAKFRELQRFVADGSTDRIRLDVMLSMSAAPPGATSAPVWVEAMLSPKDGYFTLVDGAAIPLGGTRTYRSGGKSP